MKRTAQIARQANADLLKHSAAALNRHHIRAQTGILFDEGQFDIARRDHFIIGHETEPGRLLMRLKASLAAVKYAEAARPEQLPCLRH